MSRWIQLALNVIGDQNHDDVGGFGRIGGGEHFQSGRFGLGPAFASRYRPTTTFDARIAQIQRVRVALAAVADNGDRLAF